MDRQTTCDRNTALCTIVLRAVKIQHVAYQCPVDCRRYLFRRYRIDV